LEEVGLVAVPEQGLGVGGTAVELFGLVEIGFIGPLQVEPFTFVVLFGDVLEVVGLLKHGLVSALLLLLFTC